MPQKLQSVESSSEAALAQEHDPTHLCSQDPEQIAAGVAAILHQHILAAKTVPAEDPAPDNAGGTITPDCRTPFHAKAVSKVSIDAYLRRIRQHLPCSASCFVLALVYLDRIARIHPCAAICELTCHRLVLTSIMFATRFYDEEEETHFHNAWFAKLGGLGVAALASLEVEFLRLIDWRLYVSPEEYGLYHERVCSAALTLVEGSSL